MNDTPQLNLDIIGALTAAMSLATKGTSVNDLTIKHEGHEIILPVINGRPMSYDEGIDWLKKKKSEEEQTVAVNYTIECSPMDGAYAFHRALARKYGWTHQVPTPGFFGERPPLMIGINISATETVNVPYGRIEIPGISGYLQTSIATKPKTAFIINGEVLKKHAEDIKKIVALTKEVLKEGSIYRGKAVKINFAYEREGRGYDPIMDSPKFMDVSTVNENDLIFGERVMGDLQIGLFTPIEQSAACRKFSIPLKRGVLLYGPFGCGKTLTAYVTAKKAEANGWTFVYLEDVRDIKKALQFAAHYAPAVVFAEDVDRATSGDRSAGLDEVLNTLDGVDTKSGEIITVFTTNEVQKINPAMLRMGRLDTLVEVLPPDAKAAEKLVKLYARDLLETGHSLNKLGKELAGKIPAFIREVTERAKLAAIGRTNGGDIKGQVIEKDLLQAAHAMETHAKMLEPKKNGGKGNPEMFIRVPESSDIADEILSNFSVSNGHDDEIAF